MQLHKRLSKGQVVLILENYLAGEISSRSAMDTLGLKRTRFFELLAEYQNTKKQFEIVPTRTNEHLRIDPDLEKIIIHELKKEKGLIDNKNLPIKYYNYSAIRDDIFAEHKLTVSVPTIIDRAKKNGYYIEKPVRPAHDREVITNFAGELIQHDSSHHQWSPYIDQKFYLITSIDDFSRMLLFADLFERETSWTHISATERLILTNGCPLKYYPDQHSIFKFVRDRDKFTPWYTAHKFTGDGDTQFRKVLEDCGVGLTNALSPQAKGKVERPYQWFQDRIVRTAAKEHITKFEDVRNVLRDLVNRYNNQWVHSTTKEIPAVRFRRATETGQSLFRPFKIKEPFKSTKDIFCLRDQRVVNSYRKISFHNVELTVPNVPHRNTVDLRIIPNLETGLAEVRMWFKDKLVSVQQVKHTDLNLSAFDS